MDFSWAVPVIPHVSLRLILHGMRMEKSSWRISEILSQVGKIVKSVANPWSRDGGNLDHSSLVPDTRNAKIPFPSRKEPGLSTEMSLVPIKAAGEPLWKKGPKKPGSSMPVTGFPHAVLPCGKSHLTTSALNVGPSSWA